MGCEANHLPLSSGEVKNEWSHTSTVLYDFIRCMVETLPCIVREEFHSFCNFMLGVYVKIVSMIQYF